MTATEAERLALRRVVPLPETPSQEVDPAHPSLPRSVRTAVKAAADHHPRVFWARGPRIGADGAVLEEQCYTIGLRVDVAPGRRVVMVWRKKDDAWVFHEGFLRPGRTSQVEGASYRLMTELVNHDIATKAIKEGWT